MELKACRSCHEPKPLDHFYGNRRAADGRFSECKPCHNFRRDSRRKVNPDEVRSKNLRRLYGLDIEDYNSMLEAQSGRCAICETTEPGGRGGFHVDHDHDTGVVRGLLCYRCNVGIGYLADEPQRLLAAAAYLMEHGK